MPKSKLDWSTRLDMTKNNNRKKVMKDLQSAFEAFQTAQHKAAQVIAGELQSEGLIPADTMPRIAWTNRFSGELDPVIGKDPADGAFAYRGATASKKGGDVF